MQGPERAERSRRVPGSRAACSSRFVGVIRTATAAQRREVVARGNRMSVWIRVVDEGKLTVYILCVRDGL